MGTATLLGAAAWKQISNSFVYRLMRSALRRLLTRSGPPLVMMGAVLTSRPRCAVRPFASVGLGTSVLVRNGVAAAPWLSKDRLLQDYAGAYTTARTVDQQFIFELSMHCERLHRTALAVLDRKVQEADSTVAVQSALAFLKAEGPQGLKPLVRKDVQAALAHLASQLPSGADFQITMLVTCDTQGAHTPAERGFDLFTYVQSLPEIEPMVDVQARQAQRRTPTIKDVQWVTDRQALEEIQEQAGVNEIVMYDAEGFITEGLQSNFFAIDLDGTLVTAPDDRVLSGTVRKAVLEVAKIHNLKVRFACPNVRDLEKWESCFLCSTSRLVKPIKELSAPLLGLGKHFPLSSSRAHQVEELVLGLVRSHSEPLTE